MHDPVDVHSHASAAAVGQALGSLTLLTFLDIYFLQHRAIEKLAAALRPLSRLVHLDLSYSDIDGDGLAALRPALGGLTALTFLTFYGNYFHDDGVDIDVLAPVLGRLSQLAHLDLGWCKQYNEVPDALAAQLGHLTALTCLKLARFGPGVKVLAPSLPRLPRLARLDLQWVRGNMRDEIDVAEALAPHLGQLTALTLLDMSHMDISDGGIALLAPALARLPRLAALNLSYNSLGRPACHISRLRWHA